jgi:hypothetical protein
LIYKRFNYFLILPLESDAKIPAAHRIVNITNAVFILLSKAAEFEYEILDCPIKSENISRARPMLNICPVKRIVDKVEEATPRFFLSTELRTAFVFGEENKANPNPRNTRLTIIETILVCIFRKIRINNPIVVIIIPAEATICGSILSDNFPERGEKTAIIIGWETKTKPVV